MVVAHHYPKLRSGYKKGILPKSRQLNRRCSDHVHYEVMKHLGFFVTESSEHFAEYVPWFIKPHRQDLIEKFHIPLDEYPKRCEEQIESWKQQAEVLTQSKKIDVSPSKEFARTIIEATWCGNKTTIYGNIANHNLIYSTTNWSCC